MGEPRVGGLYLVLFEGEWTAGRVTAGGIVVVGDSNERPLSLVEQWGPEISVLPHPSALVPDPRMLADGWAPVEGATYQARAGVQSAQDLVAVVFRLAFMMGHQAGRFGGAEVAIATRPAATHFEGEFGEGKVSDG